MRLRLETYQRDVKEVHSKQNRTDPQLATWLMTEAAEVADLIHKNDVYNRSFSVEELLSELGDVLHFVTIIGQRYGFSLIDIMEDNVDKLIERGWLE